MPADPRLIVALDKDVHEIAALCSIRFLYGSCKH